MCIARVILLLFSLPAFLSMLGRPPSPIHTAFASQETLCCCGILERGKKRNGCDSKTLCIVNGTSNVRNGKSKQICSPSTTHAGCSTIQRSVEYRDFATTSPRARIMIAYSRILLLALSIAPSPHHFICECYMHATSFALQNVNNCFILPRVEIPRSTSYQLFYAKIQIVVGNSERMQGQSPVRLFLWLPEQPVRGRS